MHPDEVRSLIESHSLSLPYTIYTSDGRSYLINDHSNDFITAAYPNTLFLAVRGKGIAHLDLASIDSIHNEYESDNSS